MTVIYCTEMVNVMKVEMNTQGEGDKQSLQSIIEDGVILLLGSEKQEGESVRQKDLEIQGCKIWTITWRYSVEVSFISSFNHLITQIGSPASKQSTMQVTLGVTFISLPRMFLNKIQRNWF